MAYRRQPQKILAGSLNLAAPTDSLPENDSIALHNFRVDRHGSLRSRMSSAALPSVSLVGYVHTLFRQGNDRYFGAGANLYRQTGAVGAVVDITANPYDGTRLGLAAFQGYLWIMNRAANSAGRDEGGSTVNTWLPAIPGVATVSLSLVAGGALVEGIEYTYWVTNLTSDGQETNPQETPELITPTVGNNTVEVAYTGTADGRVTHWNVYRSGNTMDGTYRVNPDPIPVASTTYNDTGDGDHTDLAVQTRGRVLETDHDDPPEARGLVGPHYERLIAFSSAAHPNRYWWTPKNKPYYFPGSALDEGNHNEVGDESDEIVAATLHPSQIRFYKKKSIWRLRGDAESGVLEQTNAELGLIGAGAIASVGGFDYFQGQEGIYVSNGDTIRKISGRLDPLFRNAISFALGSSPLLPLNEDETYRAKNVLAVKNGRLYFSYCPSGQTAPTSTLVCNLETLDWATEDNIAGTGYTALHYEGQYSELLGATNGVVYALENENTTENRALLWTSGYKDQGNSERKKTYAELTIEHSTKRSAATDRNLAVALKLDSGDTADVALGNIPVATTGAGVERTVSILPVPNKGVKARNVALKVSGSSDVEVAIHRATLHFYIEPRDARTFDSDESDLGDPNLKDFELLWLDIDADGIVTWEVLTDLPGNAMALRQTATFAATGGRIAIPIQLDAVEGRLIRVTLSCPVFFRLYGARLLYRRIGVYLDGTKANVFETQNIAIAI